MRKRLLSFFALAMIAVGVSAVSWTRPTAPTAPFEGVDYVADGTTAYYLYNVESGQFLSAGNSWATQISMGKDHEAYMQLVVEPMTDDDAETYPGCVKLKLNGEFKFSGDHGRTDYAVADKYLFRDSETSGFVDHNTQVCWYWFFEKAASGNYYWHSAPEMGGFDAMSQFAAAQSAGEPVVFNKTAEDMKIEWKFVAVNGYDTAWKQTLTDLFALFDKKMELYELAIRIETEGWNVDYTKYTDAYNGSDAAAVDAAIAALEEAIVAAQVAELFEGATPDDPKDGTSLLKNSDFSAGNISGWTVEVPGGQNLGYQANATYTNDVDDDENNGVTIQQFIEAWVPGKGLGTGKISQVLKYLPAGKYALEADVMATRQYMDPADEVTGTQLFAKGGDIDKYTKIGTPNGKPRHYKLVFASTGGDIEMGLRIVDTDANWIAADNFQLWYYGPVNPWQATLEDAIEEFDNTYPDVDDVAVNSNVYDAMMDALETAKAEVEKTDGDYEAAYNALVAAEEAFDASVADYKHLRQLLDEYWTKLEGFEGTKWAGIADFISDDLNAAEDAYEEGEYTKDDIDALEQKLAQNYNKGFGELVAEGDDLTFLLNNPGFDGNFSGWTVDTSDGRKNLQYGGSPVNLEDETVLESGVAEVWKGKFDMSQTIYNMPSGLYTLSVKAFERNETDQSNRTTSSELYAIVAGETQTVKTMNINDDATDEPLFDESMAGEGAVGTESDKENGEGKYIPNGRCGANVHFYYGGYENKFNIRVAEMGDIVVGMRDDKDDNWVLFDDFRIIYRGNGAGAYAEAIQDLIDRANAVPELEDPSTGRVLTQEMLNLLAAAARDGQAVLAKGSSATKDECEAVMDELQAAIDEAKASMEKTADLFKLYVIYHDYRVTNVESNDADYLTLLDDIYAHLTGDLVFNTNAEVDDYKQQMIVGYTKYVQYDALATATEANPADITAVIYNPDCKGYDTNDAVGAEGWTVSEGSVGYGNGGKQVAEFYGQAFDINQTILGLAPGYYVLGVQGFYRDGTTARIDSCLNKVEGFEEHKYAHLYAGEADTYMLPISTDLQGVLDAGITEGVSKVTVKETEFLLPNTAACANAVFNDAGLYVNKLLFQVKEGQESVVIGLRKTHNENVKEDKEAGIEAFDYADWTVFDNWTLMFLGTQAPTTDPTTDIQGVEAEAPAVAVIYNLAGQRVAKAQKGIYIINGRKVVVK